MAITDIENNPMVQGIIAQLRTLTQQIAEIDAQLGLDENASDQQKRNAVAEKFLPSYSESISKLASHVVSTINSNVSGEDGTVDAEKQAALYRGLVAALQSEFGKTVNEYLDTRTSEVTTSSATPEARQEMEKSRRDSLKLFKLSAEMLKTMQIPMPSDIEEPKRKMGSRGPALANSEYHYSVKQSNGEFKLMKDFDLSQVANVTCKPLGWTTRDLKEFLIDNVEEATVSTNEKKQQILTLPRVFEVTLPAPVNKVLRGEQIGETPVPEDDEPSSDDNGDSDVSF